MNFSKKIGCVALALLTMGGAMVTLPAIGADSSYSIIANAATTTTKYTISNSKFKESDFKTAGQKVIKDNTKWQSFGLYAKNKGTSDSVTISRTGHIIKKTWVSENQPNYYPVKKTEYKNSKGQITSVKFTATKSGYVQLNVQYDDGVVQKCGVRVYYYTETDKTLTSQLFGGLAATVTVSSFGDAPLVGKDGYAKVYVKNVFNTNNVNMNVAGKNNKKIAMSSRAGAFGKARVYIAFEDGIRVFNVTCTPTFNRRLIAGEGTSEAWDGATLKSVSVIEGTDIVGINSSSYSTTESGKTYRGFTYSGKKAGKAKIKAVWSFNNGSVVLTSYYIVEVKPKTFVAGSSDNPIAGYTIPLDRQSGRTVNINAYPNASFATNIGLTAYAMKAYCEDWQYVYGGTNPSKRQVDCGGLIWSYKGVGGNAFDLLGSSKSSGLVANGVPRIHGLGLHQPGHAGVYIGSNCAIDARSQTYDCVLQNVYTKGWVEWYRVRGVAYPEKGFVKINGKNFYYENGQYVVSCSKTIDGKIYKFDENGVCKNRVDSSYYGKTTWVMY